MKLLSDVKLLDDRTVTLDVNLCEVAEKVSSVTYHLEKATTAVVVLVVVLEVCVEAVDAVCEKRDLNLGRACVAFVSLVLVNDCLFYVFLHGFFTFQIINFTQTQMAVGEKMPDPSLLSAIRVNVFYSIIPLFLGKVNIFYIIIVNFLGTRRFFRIYLKK